MRAYEVVVLLHPDLEIDADAPISKLEKLVETAGGKVIKRDNWGKKRLAYRINKQDFAVYVYFEVELESTKVPGFERALILTEEVMRHLIVSKEENAPKEEPKKAKAAVVADKEANKSEGREGSSESQADKLEKENS
jgi:small subunit ribosomal protein S6